MPILKHLSPRAWLRPRTTSLRVSALLLEPPFLGRGLSSHTLSDVRAREEPRRSQDLNVPSRLNLLQSFLRVPIYQRPGVWVNKDPTTYLLQVPSQRPWWVSQRPLCRAVPAALIASDPPSVSFRQLKTKEFSLFGHSLNLKTLGFQNGCLLRILEKKLLSDLLSTRRQSASRN